MNNCDLTHKVTNETGPKAYRPTIDIQIHISSCKYQKYNLVPKITIHFVSTANTVEEGSREDNLMMSNNHCRMTEIMTCPVLSLSY